MTDASLAPETITRAQAFLLEKWRERAAERCLPEPADLSGACKFAAAFAQAVLGGEIRAHDLHCWIVLDGRVVDLCRDAADAREMAAGRIPASLADYASIHDVGIPEEGLYAHDADFAVLEGFREALASNAPRVARWIAEYRDLDSTSA